MRLLITTYGTRGDVQPYLVLSLELQRQGHSVIMMSDISFQSWVESYGVKFVSLHSPDPQEVFEALVEKSLSLTFFMTSIRKWVRDFLQMPEAILNTALEFKPDTIISTYPSLYSGIHVAEKIQCKSLIINLFASYETKDFYHPYSFSKYLRYSTCIPSLVNLFSHKVMNFAYGFFLTLSVMKLRRSWSLPFIPSLTRWSKLNETPKILAYSSSILPCIEPNHFQFGYYFTDEVRDIISDEVQNFVSNSRVIYVGFGSIKLSSRMLLKLTEVLQGVVDLLPEYKFIFSIEVKITSDRVLIQQNIPHQWLFKYVCMAIHHGGLGTTNYALRAGIPSIILPFFGDQYFWSQRLHEIKYGTKALTLETLTSQGLKETIQEVEVDTELHSRLASLSQKLQTENGVEETVKFLESL